mmetsp:Transcript_8150/g.19451  ORF Transcript_8150/g.19451 Transcript_8150/m.19451 type:complete len:263 (-) Transcript_8150:217-1005(-)
MLRHPAWQGEGADPAAAELDCSGQNHSTFLLMDVGPHFQELLPHLASHPAIPDPQARFRLSVGILELAKHVRGVRQQSASIINHHSLGRAQWLRRGGETEDLTEVLGPLCTSLVHPGRVAANWVVLDVLNGKILADQDHHEGKRRIACSHTIVEPPHNLHLLLTAHAALLIEKEQQNFSLHISWIKPFPGCLLQPERYSTELVLPAFGKRGILRRLRSGSISAAKNTPVLDVPRPVPHLVQKPKHVPRLLLRAKRGDRRGRY